MIDRLRRRFDIARVCVVADRGMISAETMAELEARRLLYILGVRERSDKLVRELVLDDPGPFVPLTTKKRGKGIDYEAKRARLEAGETSRGAIMSMPRRSDGWRANRLPLHRESKLRLGLVVEPRFFVVSGTNGPGSSSTNSRTSLSERSRTLRIYKSRRGSSSAIVSALIMPRARSRSRPASVLLIWSVAATSRTESPSWNSCAQ